MVKEQKKLRNKLNQRYKLVILGAQTLEERFSVNLSLWNILAICGTILVTLMVGFVVLVIYTPLKEYIPGYTDVGMKRELYKTVQRLDSVERSLKNQKLFMSTLRAITSGDKDALTRDYSETKPFNLDSSQLDNQIGSEEERLRNMVESQDRFELNLVPPKHRGGLETFNLFPPIEGIITEKFNPGVQHFGIDIVSKVDQPVKSVMDGSVILSTYTMETGYIIGIQHSQDLVSFYKHNSTLLKKVGNFVKAGEVVAVVGNTGEYSTGPHLHFELWHKGAPVNPEDYISF